MDRATDKVLNDIRLTLIMAYRIGKDEDVPEGVRFIQMSDTLANKIIKSIDGLKHDQEDEK